MRRRIATITTALLITGLLATPAQAKVVKLYFPGMYFTSTIGECRYIVNGDIVGTMRLNGIEFGYGCQKR